MARKSKDHPTNQELEERAITQMMANRIHTYEIIRNATIRTKEYEVSSPEGLDICFDVLKKLYSTNLKNIKKQDVECR